MSGLTSVVLNDFIRQELPEFTYQKISNLANKIQLASDVKRHLAHNQPLDQELQNEYLNNAKQAFCNIFSLLGKLLNILEKLENGTWKEQFKAGTDVLTAPNDIKEIQENFKCLSDKNILQVFNPDTAIFASQLLFFLIDYEDDITTIVETANEEQYALAGIIKNLIPKLQQSIKSFNHQNSQAQADCSSSNYSDESTYTETQEELISAEFFSDIQTNLESSIARLSEEKTQLDLIKNFIIKKQLHVNNKPIPDTIEINLGIILTKKYLRNLLAQTTIPENILKDLFDSIFFVNENSYNILFENIDNKINSLNAQSELLKKEQEIIELFFILNKQQAAIVNILANFNSSNNKECNEFIESNFDLIIKLETNLNDIQDSPNLDKYIQQIVLLKNKNYTNKRYIIEFQEKKNELEAQKNHLENTFTGENGKLSAYMVNREKVLRISLIDWFSLRFAIFLGCFNYKPEKTARENYIKNLEKTITYNLANDNYGAILSEIEKGLTRFSPRIFDKENSLKATLLSLKAEIIKLTDNFKSLESIPEGQTNDLNENDESQVTYNL